MQQLTEEKKALEDQLAHQRAKCASLQHELMESSELLNDNRCRMRQAVENHDELNAELSKMQMLHEVAGHAYAVLSVDTKMLSNIFECFESNR